MASTDRDRSLSSGMFIPSWMRSKISDNRLDFEQSAFSPPSEDFLYIHYPPKGTQPKDQAVATTTAGKYQQIIIASSKMPDYTRHTLPCQHFIPNVKPAEKPQPKLPPNIKVKSNGTDDGYKGEAAACGSSIVRVAHQMVSGKTIKGFSLENNEPCNDNQLSVGFNANLRRGSRSLPASPLSSPANTPNSSPKSKKKLLSNMYFTGPFVDEEKEKHGWILSSLLSKREDFSKSTGNLSKGFGKNLTEVTSGSADGLSEKKKATHFKPKPSELREMNFWSPTSM